MTLSKKSHKPAKEEYLNLFRKEWSEEKIEKPSRDAAFWILRLLGFGYLIYLLILLIGLFGTAHLPNAVSGLIRLTYDNPALAVNTYFKITLMIMLAFMAAFNKSLCFIKRAFFL